MLTGYVTKTKVKDKGPYYYTIEVPTNGKRQRIVRTSFKKKHLAIEALEKHKVALEKERASLSDKQENDQTLGDYLKNWLKTVVRHNKAHNTYKGYESIVRNHIEPILGHIKLSDLQVQDIKNYYAEKREDLSGLSVRHHHQLLSKALNDACKSEFITRNVVLSVEKPTAEPFAPTFYTKDELNALYEAAKASAVYYPFIFIDGETGLRLGELRALTWRDVDLKRKIIIVNKTAFDDGEGNVQIKKSTKANKHRRVVIGKKLLAFLQAHFAAHQALKEQLGPSYNPKNLVCPNALGDYIKPRELHRAYKKAIQKAGLPDARIHDLRHSHCSILLLRNIHPKVVSERMGHASITITIEIYGHFMPSLQEQAMYVFDQDDDDWE